ncbi:unnamed protein product [Effrenium voratum]|nr:unnamed protein product [Effrenium voratum]
MAKLQITGLSGQSLQLEMAKESSVRNLKAEIEARWAVPQICQKLLCRGQLLGDSQLVVSLADWELQLIVSIQALRQSLQSPLAAEALAGLLEPARLGDLTMVWPSVEKEVWDCLRAPELHEAAAQVLTTAAQAKRPSTRQEVLLRLQSSDERSRLMCVKMLAAMGDDESLLRDFLKDRAATVRAEALTACARKRPVERSLMVAISSHLHDTSVTVRSAAVQALARFVSASGCSELADSLDFACMAILSRLQHPDTSVRGFVAAAARGAVVACAAADCGLCLGARRPRAQEEPTWSAFAAELLSPCLRDVAAVQGVALQAIAELPGRGRLGRELLELRPQVFPCLSHADAGVRISAAGAMTRLAPKGDQELIEALRALAKKDPDISVRTASKNALPVLGVDPY